MNKMIKGSIAGATGVALLMGGFGTYALWTDTEAIAGGVTSGELDIVSAGVATYQDISADATSTTWSASTLMVPGDKVEMTQPLDVNAAGKNLKAKVSLTGVASDFDSQLVVTLSYAGKSTTVNGTNIGTAALNFGSADITALNAATDAVVTFELPSTVDNQENQGSAVDLSAAAVQIDQVRP